MSTLDQSIVYTILNLHKGSLYRHTHMHACSLSHAHTNTLHPVGAIQGVDALVTPALKAIMSRLVEPEDQGLIIVSVLCIQCKLYKLKYLSPPLGALFSFISATQVLATVVAYVVYALAYSRTLLMRWSAGTSFYLMAILYIVPVPFMM